MKLDKSSIKALSSDTRIDILKSLNVQRRMPSELARELNIRPSTVAEHLKILSRAGMVEAISTGHKWKYYKLTTKGKNLVRPKAPVQFVIILTIGLIMIIAGFDNVTAVVDFEYSYPIVSVTKTITETIEHRITSIGTSSDSASATSVEGVVDDMKDIGDTDDLEISINTTERIENETDYGTDYIPIEQINWMAVIIIIAGSILTILSMKKIVIKWLK
jgi:DNA-binding transcriptional ArsR family regulator